MSYITVTENLGYEHNNVLEIGSPEYNKIRYRAYKTVEEGILRYRKPVWLKDLQNDLAKKRSGQWRFDKRKLLQVDSHPAHETFISDISHCIRNGLKFKTKTFEYDPVMGKLYVNDNYVGTYDKICGTLKSFTLKNINSKLSRFRLRDFGVDLIQKGERTYWKIPLSLSTYQHLLSLGFLKTSYATIFKSVSIKENEISSRVLVTPGRVAYCELKPNIEYPIFKSNSSMFAIKPTIFHFPFVNKENIVINNSDTDLLQQEYLETNEFFLELITSYQASKDLEGFKRALGNSLSNLLINPVHVAYYSSTLPIMDLSFGTVEFSLHLCVTKMYVIVALLSTQEVYVKTPDEGFYIPFDQILKNPNFKITNRSDIEYSIPDVNSFLKIGQCLKYSGMRAYLAPENCSVNGVDLKANLSSLFSECLSETTFNRPKEYIETLLQTLPGQKILLSSRAY